MWALDGPDGTWDADVALVTRETTEDLAEYFTVDRPAAGLSDGEDARDPAGAHDRPLRAWPSSVVKIR